MCSKTIHAYSQSLTRRGWISKTKSATSLIFGASVAVPSSANALEKRNEALYATGFFVNIYQYKCTDNGGASLSGVSPALLAKFGIMSPPTPDQGADRRATILPVLFLIDRDPVMGCKAVTVNRRSGALIGDLATIGVPRIQYSLLKTENGGDWSHRFFSMLV
jgi:hypothetical protein